MTASGGMSNGPFYSADRRKNWSRQRDRRLVSIMAYGRHLGLVRGLMRWGHRFERRDRLQRLLSRDTLACSYGEVGSEEDRPLFPRTFSEADRPLSASVGLTGRPVGMTGVGSRRAALDWLDTKADTTLDPDGLSVTYDAGNGVSRTTALGADDSYRCQRAIGVCLVPSPSHWIIC